jgi:large subunit ribosomal protein L15
MVNLQSLPKIGEKPKKRVGRGLGSGKGAKSGRGTTRHQKAREKIKLWFEGGQNRMTKKFPLLRGKGRNKPRKLKPLLIKLDKLNQFPSHSQITLETLIDRHLVPQSAKKTGVKILASGELKQPLVIKLPISKRAKLKVEQAGGKVIVP